MAKVSFDFDSTLSREDVQEYAKQLINQGHEVWICTSRYGDEYLGDEIIKMKWGSNEDLYIVAKRLGIDQDKIIFTNMSNKSSHVAANGFIFHLDDDHIELQIMHEDQNPYKGVFVERKDYQKVCNEILNNYE